MHLTAISGLASGKARPGLMTAAFCFLQALSFSAPFTLAACLGYPTKLSCCACPIAGFASAVKPLEPLISGAELSEEANLAMSFKLANAACLNVAAASVLSDLTSNVPRGLS